ncbi:hypothetical protein F7725_001226 [Dissostichus mawsoni]|uniref:Uncharacterized protein n=1 Tax=Dissostichus mawsoni TaxID=36200 RepID=A0A7J5ZIQ3_DISMA|nr:hypothetical protein F7725_001226 [Dissostichus mawsoni]
MRKENGAPELPECFALRVDLSSLCSMDSSPSCSSSRSSSSSSPSLLLQTPPPPAAPTSLILGKLLLFFPCSLWFSSFSFGLTRDRLDNSTEEEEEEVEEEEEEQEKHEVDSMSSSPDLLHSLTECLGLRMLYIDRGSGEVSVLQTPDGPALHRLQLVSRLDLTAASRRAAATHRHKPVRQQGGG